MEKPKLEEVLTSYHKEDMIAMIKKHDLFEEVLTESILSNNISPRAAYMLFHLMSKNDSRLINNLESIINSIEGKTDGQQRDLVRVLLNMDLNKDQEGKTYDLCTKLWTNTFKKPATRYLGLKFIFETAKKYSELKEDFKLLTDEHYVDSLSHGVKHSVKKMIANL